MNIPPRVDVVGTGISTGTVEETVALILDPPPTGMRVAVCTVHSVMTARRDPALRAALTSADITTPDGVPLTWALRLSGVPGQERVDGYSVFHHTIETGLERKNRHFLYGATPETLAKLVTSLRSTYPEIQIVGTHAPPFRPLTDDEFGNDMAQISGAAPDVVWVGIGMPKQELWMARAEDWLPGVSLVGVGAVFDWVAGNVPKAPAWMQRAGLEWLFRVYREPRRLWRRYLWNNPAYLGLLAAQIVRSKTGAAPVAGEHEQPSG